MLLDDETLVFLGYRILKTPRIDIMRNRIQHIGLVVWLLVYVPFAQATFGEAVLCLGSDGHVALENTDFDGVCHDEAHLSDVLELDCLVEDHCGNCLDLLPNIDALNRSHSKLILENALVVVDALPVIVVSHPLQSPPVSFLKHLHLSVPTTVLQI